MSKKYPTYQFDDAVDYYIENNRNGFHRYCEREWLFEDEEEELWLQAKRYWMHNNLSEDERQDYEYAKRYHAAEYENACDCLYYGEGKDVWNCGGLEGENKNRVWNAARLCLSYGHRYYY